MNIFTVAFFGHRIIDNPFPVEQNLEKIIRELLHSKEYVEFLVGRDGDFDQLVSSTVRRCKRAVRDDNSALVWVMPYETAEYRDNEEAFHDYYDDVGVCGASAVGHFKGAHQKRNREMVDRADLIVCYIERENGGAWQTIKYAIGHDKAIINLAKENEATHL